MTRADLFSGSLVVWHIRGGAAHFYPASPEPPLSGGEAIPLSGTQNPNSENWRCLLVKIFTPLNLRSKFVRGELFLTKIRTLVSKKLFCSGGQKGRGLGGEGIFARPRFRRFFFRRRNFSCQRSWRATFKKCLLIKS